MAGDPMDHIIKQAEHNLFQRGSDAVSERDVILATAPQRRRAPGLAACSWRCWSG